MKDNGREPLWYQRARRSINKRIPKGTTVDVRDLLLLLAERRRGWRKRRAEVSGDEYATGQCTGKIDAADWLDRLLSDAEARSTIGVSGWL
jgi:hypothetical protein